MKKPIISIIIPIFNGEKTIRRAIRSVISQTYFINSELILIDDGSNDKSINVIQTFMKKYPNISLIRNKHNLGIAKTQNIGLKRARGKYVARLDQDDEWTDNKKLEKQAIMLEKNPSLGLVGTWAKIINKDGQNFNLTPATSDQGIRLKVLLANMFIAPSIMIKKELTRKIGYYREDLIHGTEDYEYWLRIGTIMKFANIPNYCLKYNFSPKSYSFANKIKAIAEHLAIIKQYKNSYPHYKRALIKNLVEYNLLKIKFLQKYYHLIVPKIAGKIYM